MATITLPSDVILEILKFVSYENTTKLLVTSKSWVKTLQVRLKEQRIAILAEIQRLENSDLEDKESSSKVNSTWNGLLRDEKQLCADLKTNAFNAKNFLEQNAAVALFNQRRQAIKADMDAQYYEYSAIARKRQPILDKIENLVSILGQCGESETERFAELERRKKRYFTALCVTEVFGVIALLVGFGAIITLIAGFKNEWEKLLLYSHILLLISGIDFVAVLPLLFFIYSKLERLRDFIQGKLDCISNNLKLKASRDLNKTYVK